MVAANAFIFFSLEEAVHSEFFTLLRDNGHSLLTVFFPLHIFISPIQCLCHFGGGGLHRAGALSGIHPGHSGVCFQQIPAQKSSHSLRCHRNTCRLSGAPSQ